MEEVRLSETDVSRMVWCGLGDYRGVVGLDEPKPPPLTPPRHHTISCYASRGERTMCYGAIDEENNRVSSRRSILPRHVLTLSPQSSALWHRASSLINAAAVALRFTFPVHLSHSHCLTYGPDLVTDLPPSVQPLPTPASPPPPL